MKKALALILAMIALLSLSISYAENVIQLEYDLIIRDITLSGSYSGEMKNGMPEGYGVYETVTPDGTPCHYIGQWKNGVMHGNGAMYWTDGSLEIGEYVNGIFLSGKYNYNGLKLLTAKVEGDETLNPYWLISRKAAAEEDTVKFIGNKSSKVFHTLDCDSVRTMKEKNKVEFHSVEEAEEKHYKPCSRCNPH